MKKECYHKFIMTNVFGDFIFVCEKCKKELDELYSKRDCIKIFKELIYDRK